MPGWNVLYDVNADVLAVHAALLHTGHILFFGGNNFNLNEHNRWARDHALDAIDHSRLFKCATGEIFNPGSPTTDVFCCGHAFLANGDLLIAGGTQDRPLDNPDLDDGVHHGHWPGIREAWIFSGERHEWLPAAEMLPDPLNETVGGGRWYPTLLTLPNGKVIALAGHPSHEDSRHQNNIPEIYDPGSNTWSRLADSAFEANEKNLGDAGDAPPFRIAQYRDDQGLHSVITFYPRCYILPGGEIFCADPPYHYADTNIRNVMRHKSIRFRPERSEGEQAQLLPPPPYPYNTNFGNTGARFTSVLLPLLPECSYRARVMVCGASGVGGPGGVGFGAV